MLKVILDNSKLNPYSNLGFNQLQDAFSKIKEEFEDHLTAINENTNEIQANYEYLSEIDDKIEKICQRLEKIELFLQKNSSFKIEEKPSYKLEQLTKREQEVFLMLYTLEEKGPVSYRELSRKTGLPEELISSYIISMVQKGVPIKKKYVANKAFLFLDKQFKNIQAKENILNIEQKTLL